MSYGQRFFACDALHLEGVTRWLSRAVEAMTDPGIQGVPTTEALYYIQISVVQLYLRQTLDQVAGLLPPEIGALVVQVLQAYGVVTERSVVVYQEFNEV